MCSLQGIFCGTAVLVFLAVLVAPASDELSSNRGSDNWLEVHETKHRQHRKHGPHFDDLLSDNTTVIARVGHTVLFNCRVSLLRDKTVSWVRKTAADPPTLLTVGGHTHTADRRVSVQFQYPGNWRLRISGVSKRDEGVYECQVSTHPPTVIRSHLTVEAPEVVIVDEFGSALKEQFYDVGSTLQLRCVVRGVLTLPRPPVRWLHGDTPLPLRGGIAVKTDHKGSTLHVGGLDLKDAGNYTCAVPPYTRSTVYIHVLSEEMLSELHLGEGAVLPPLLLYVVTPGLGALLLLLLLIS